MCKFSFVFRVSRFGFFNSKPSARNTRGGIVKKEAPIHISNVMLWDSKKSEATKVKRNRDEGKLVRVSKKSGEVY